MAIRAIILAAGTNFQLGTTFEHKKSAGFMFIAEGLAHAFIHVS